MLGECPRASREREGCPFMNSPEGCKSNTHHLFWPRRIYKTALEREFRELPENKVQMCKWEHLDLHEFTFPPQKPNHRDMIKAIMESTTQLELFNEGAA